MATQIIKSTTQNFLDIYDILNNVILMKDGSASIVLTTSSMNFDLLAEEEQDAVIYSYAALLNSLNYSVQINIQSKTKDATAYLSLLQKQQESASSPQKARAIAQYQTFVSELIRERNVLEKKFYVVIPTTATEMGFYSADSFIPGKKGFDATTVEKNVILEKALSILEPRRDHLVGQFNRIGIFARQLETQEIIQIFYINYNPEAAEGQMMGNSNEYTGSLVTTSVQLPTPAYALTPETAQSPPLVVESAVVSSAPQSPAPQPQIPPLAAEQPAPAPALSPLPVINQPSPESTQSAIPTVAAIEPDPPVPAATAAPIATTQPIPAPLASPVTQPPVSTPNEVAVFSQPGASLPPLAEIK